jgi:capsular polysaccharide biosynthesis protein
LKNRNLFYSLIKNGLIIIWCIIICSSFSWYFTFHMAKTQYEAVSSIMVLNKPADSSVLENDNPKDTELILDLLASLAIVNDFQTIILSDVILEKVKEQLASEYPWAKTISLSDLHSIIDVNIKNDTRILNISAVDTNPQHAAVMSKTVKEVFTDFARKLTVQKLIIPVNDAEIPNNPSFPHPTEFIGLSVIIGLLTGVILTMSTARSRRSF